MNKKTIILASAILFLSAGAVSANWFTDLFFKPEQPQLGATTIKVPNGGTGATSFDVGECLYGNGTGAIYSDACAAGSMTALPETQLYVGNSSDTAVATSAFNVLPYRTICRTGSCDYKADGTADDVQIQEAVNDLDLLGGGTLFFKAGVYSLTATITLPFDPHIKFLGEKIVKNTSGVTATSGVAVLQADAAIYSMFSMSGAASASTNADLSHDFQLESLMIEGNDQTTNCFLLTNTDFIKIRDFRIRGCTNGIKTAYNGVDPATAASKPGGIFLESGSFGVTSNVGGVNVDLQDQTQVWISDVWFSGTASSTIIASSSNKIHISNSEFNTANAAITFGDRGNTVTSDITVNNSVFNVGSGNNICVNNLGNSGSTRLSFSGNTYPSGTPCDLTSIYQAVIQPFTTVSNGDFSIIPNGTGDVGIGTANPSKDLHVYRDDTSINPQLLLEQDGTGDALLQFYLTNSRAWNVGVDNSDAQNSFKISTNSAGFDGGSTEYFKIDQTGLITQATTTLTGSLTFPNYSSLIKTNTSDGSDNAQLQIIAGGAYEAGRGAYLALDGNEYSVNPGNAYLVAGNVAGSFITLGSDTLISGTATTTNLAVTGNTKAGTVISGTWNGTAVGATYGGTGLTSFSGGSLLYASGANTWAALASSTNGYVLQLNASGYPAWVSTSTLGITGGGSLDSESDPIASSTFKLQRHVSAPTTWSKLTKTLAYSVGNQGFIAAVNGYAYLFGGCPNDCNDIQRAPLNDPTTWSDTGEDLPGAMGATVGAVIGDRIFLFGGNNGATGHANIYNATTSDPTAWIDTGKDLPNDVVDSQLAIVGDNIYLYGGQSDSNYSDVIFTASTSDPTTWGSAGSLPFAIANHQLAVIGDYLYIFAGNSTSGATTTVLRAPLSAPTTFTAYYDALPGVLYNSQLAIIDDSIYLFGGYDASAISNVIYRASISDPLTWSDTGATLPEAVYNANLIVIDDNIYIVGGNTADGYDNHIYKAGIRGSSEYANSWKYALDYSKGITWGYGSGGGAGSVTSVAMTVPTGLSISGSPITDSGTLALSLTAGYEIPKIASTTNWNTGAVCFPFASSTDIQAGTLATVGAFPYSATVIEQNAKVIGEGTSLVLNLTDGTNDMTAITATTTRASNVPSSNTTWTKGEDVILEFGTNTGSVRKVNYCAIYLKQ